jgi:hypothetical protein
MGVYLWLSPLIGFMIMVVFNATLIFSLYIAFSKKVKEEELYLDDSVLRKAIMGVSGFFFIVQFIALFFVIMHWPGSNLFRPVSLFLLIIQISLTAIDLYVRLRNNEKIHGYMYFLLLLSSLYFVFMNARVMAPSGYQERKEIALQSVGRDNHLQSDLSRIIYNNIQLFKLAGSVDSLKVLNIRTKTEEISLQIKMLRQSLIDKTDGFSENGEYKGLTEKTAVEVMMIGPDGSKSGSAYKLQAALRKYCSEVDGEVNCIPLSEDGKEDITLKNNKEKYHKDFAQLHFEDVMMAEALEFLSQLQLEVLLAEQKALLKLLNK